MPKTVALLGTLDTKCQEYGFVADCIHAAGLRTLLIDVGVLASPSITPHVSSQEVAEAAGVDLEAVRLRHDRGQAVAAMGRGAERVVSRLYEQKRIDGILALGGTGGTSIACQAMRSLPLGIPKVMVSTVAGTDVSDFVGVKDIIMFPSIVDVAGINVISRQVFARAAAAICGMVEAEVPGGKDKPLIAASMFGNTTKAVGTAARVLEEAGYEVLVFHCTGNGGRAMENLVAEGLVSGVLDITTTEWADELVGGVFSAGPTRLETAARQGIPAIVVPGCLDMVNFGAPDTVPSRFDDRLFYQHNPNVTLMRTNVAENERLGKILAEKLNLSSATVTVLIPLQGLSMLDISGEPFHLPEADQALFDSLKKHLRADIPVIEMDCQINDPAFAIRCAETLLENIQQKG